MMPDKTTDRDRVSMKALILRKTFLDILNPGSCAVFGGQIVDQWVSLVQL